MQIIILKCWQKFEGLKSAFNIFFTLITFCKSFFNGLKDTSKLEGGKTTTTKYWRFVVTCKNVAFIGRVPWSSSYGWQLIFERFWVWIPALYTWWTFFILICCKNCLFLKTENKTKKRPEWPIFLKKTLQSFCWWADVVNLLKCSTTMLQ